MVLVHTRVKLGSVMLLIAVQGCAVCVYPHFVLHRKAALDQCHYFFWCFQMFKQATVSYTCSLNIFGSISCVLSFGPEVGGSFTTWQVSPLTSEPKKRRRF